MSSPHKGVGRETVLRSWSALGAPSVQVQTLKFVSCLMCSEDLRAAAVPTTTRADDCHAPERNVRNHEMSKWMWIDVGLVVIGDFGWPTASPSSQTVVVGERARGGRKVRLRGEININLKFGLNV